jgi:hypothetical protein
MPIPVDNDIIRGLGFVALYAGYLEEQVDEMLFMLQQLEAYPEAEQRWAIGSKIKKAIRLVGQLQFETQVELLADLDRLKPLFEWRNEVIHGRIYANFNRQDTLKSGRPNVPEREVTASELYELANNLDAARSALLRPMFIKIPRALQAS